MKTNWNNKSKNFPKKYYPNRNVKIVKNKEPKMEYCYNPLTKTWEKIIIK